ncbi:hypothetical protein EPI10_033237 [Gossypium australe]|uniref:Uncharacterized protein n=1 Tax=Gossypium australe TaxID=47621 RepID=A0A5B6X603_9ROSI|nr:hypothetical protein EPI10_033237 [Gossypium australe]
MRGEKKQMLRKHSGDSTNLLHHQINESPFTTNRRKPNAAAKMRARSHALASATKASVTSLKR